MTKVQIEVDSPDLAAAQEFLGTDTAEATVNAALRTVAALSARRRDLRRLTSGALSDLLNRSLMPAAWDQHSR
jgi:Arc/MetJ family transcription regulator